MVDAHWVRSFGDMNTLSLSGVPLSEGGRFSDPARRSGAAKSKEEGAEWGGEAGADMPALAREGAHGAEGHADAAAEHRPIIAWIGAEGNPSMLSGPVQRSPSELVPLVVESAVDL
jgi:hypothetical protein